MNFEVIRYMNFVSIGNNFLEIPLNKHPTTLFMGKNGSGKTTLLDAICFVLYGKAFRDVNLSELVNRVNGKNCLVEVEFSVGSKKYKIRRGLAPKVFEIYENGKFLNQESATRFDQTWLTERVLRCSYDSFKQTVVLGAANFTPFMKMEKGKGRELIEKLLDLEVFSTMNDVLGDKKKQSKVLFKDKENEVSLVKEKIKIHEANLKKLSQDKEKVIAGIDAEIKKIVISVKTAQDEIVGLNEKVGVLIQEHTEKFEAVTKKQESARDAKRDLDTAISELEEYIQFYSDNTSCYTCKQTIEEEFRKQEIQVKSALRDERAELRGKTERYIQALQKELGTVNLLNEQIKQLEYEVSSREQTISLGKMNLKRLLTDKKRTEQPGENITEETKVVGDLKETLKQLEGELHQMEVEKKLFENAGILLKDSGVKAKIIRQYLPLINKTMNQYLSYMNFFSTFTLNEELKATIKNHGQMESTYGSYSEGEKQRMDIALLFTWRTVAKAKNSINTNLLILDEVFDTYLSVEDTETAISLLYTDMFKDMNVIVISHKETISDKFSNVVKFSMQKNFTKVEQ